MTRCLAPDCQMGGLGCDNMTVVLVCFLNGEPYEKLAEKCKLAPLPLSQLNNLNNNSSNHLSSYSSPKSRTFSDQEEPGQTAVSE